MWLLWLDSQRWGARPSSIMDIDDPYVAFCFDQAVGYLGSVIEGELREAGHKPSKEENKARAAQDKVIAKHFPDSAKDDSKKFADPAALFGS